MLSTGPLSFWGLFVGNDATACSLVPVSLILIVVCAALSGYMCKVAYLENPEPPKIGRTILQAVVKFQQLGLVGLREGGKRGGGEMGREGRKERGGGLGGVGDSEGGYYGGGRKEGRKGGGAKV